MTGTHTDTDPRGAPDRVQRSVKYAEGRESRMCVSLGEAKDAIKEETTWEGVAGSGWVREAGRGKTAHGWKGVRPGVRLKTGR